MNKEELRKLIMEVIKEIDPDIEGEPFDDDNIWPGSDIEGGKVGGTMFPHGHGFPGNPFRKGKKLTKSDLEKILHISYIDGVSEEDQDKFGKKCQKYSYNFIKKNSPWILTYGHKEEYGDKMWYPFAPYFSNQYQSFGYWLNGFYEEVNRQLTHFEHWINFPKEKLKNAAKYSRHWILRYKWAKQVQQQYPTIKEDLSKLIAFLGKLQNNSPTDATNSKNYPLYISLYDTTRRLGGHEEGGWWYDVDDLIQSYKVNNYKDVRKVAVHFLRIMGQADLNGKPVIVLEKEKGSKINKPPPSYS